MRQNRPKTSSIDCSRIFSGTVSLEDFLRDYWQQKPLLIRNAIPDFTSPITAEELAGLACEEDVNARLVIEKGADRPWEVEYGPFDEEIFSQLPESHWTLLVSDVEKHAPATRSIKDCFRFIPDWRMDDLMFSYAPEGGSVGPHLDAYDVFLLQASGRRNWMISTTHENQFLGDTELSILSSFNAEDSWILEPGDILYLPPGIAHHGVATEPCMTCSIGFRAPSLRAMISEYAENIANKTSDQLRYTDPGLELQEHPSEISASALDTIKHLLNEHLATNEHRVQQWFGEYMSEPRSDLQSVTPETEISNYDEIEILLKKNAFLCHSPSSRYLYSGNTSSCLLFVDGVSYPTSLAFAQALCAGHRLNSPDLSDATNSSQDRASLIDLFNRGCLYFSNEHS